MNLDSSFHGESSHDRGSRSDRRRARTRADLIAAARRVFAVRGFDASIAEITAAADVAVGTFYLHFPDKEAVLVAVLDAGLADFRAHVAGAVAGVPPERALPALIRATFHYAYRHRDLFTILLTGAGMARGLRARDELATVLAQLLYGTNDEGLAMQNIPLVARLLSGVLAQGILWWSDHDDPDPDGMAAQVLHLLRHGLPAALLGDEG